MSMKLSATGQALSVGDGRCRAIVGRLDRWMGQDMGWTIGRRDKLADAGLPGLGGPDVDGLSEVDGQQDVVTAERIGVMEYRRANAQN